MKVNANLSKDLYIYIIAVMFGGTFFHYCSYVLTTFNLSCHLTSVPQTYNCYYVFINN